MVEHQRDHRASSLICNAQNIVRGFPLSYIRNTGSSDDVIYGQIFNNLSTYVTKKSPLFLHVQPDTFSHLCTERLLVSHQKRLFPGSYE